MINPINLSVRSTGLEIMDDLDCHGSVVEQTLRELDFINKWLGGNEVTIRAVKSVWRKFPKDQPVHIADLGCGSGEMLRLLARLAAKENRKVFLKGFDANPYIIKYATDHSQEFNNISFEAINVFSEEFQAQKFDLILSTLFIHHFSDTEVEKLLSDLVKQTRSAIIINDIHRHPLAFYAIKFLTRIFSRSAMVRFDAPLSVLRAFTKKEFLSILDKAAITSFSLDWKWAFRWQLVIYTNPM
ncbi:MAG: methyltransferase domain-containing protein [Cyclobacteriaceae bacterium]|jgi:2-polyprenyl-3-methyl-5-hydroxy-6-metoxy-1,4-benzoquinol methylase|nr:methyltransferase domain-containing protein [Cyclobacteriaceae bacterium]